MRIRFDTRDKKPKLINVAVLTGITAIVILIMILLSGVIPPYVIGFTVAAYIGIVIVFLLQAFVRQLQYNPYSYNTIYYIGFSLYLLSAFILILYTSVDILTGSNLLDGGGQLLILQLLVSPRIYMILSGPFILIFSVLLCISNISLIRHEGKRFVNFLGILLAFLMAGGEVFLYFFDNFYGSFEEFFRHEIFISIFAALYLYYECMILGSIVANAIAARYEPEKDKDYIIILGCRFREDGTLTPLLKGRADRAIGFYRNQIRDTGKAPVLVPSGGQGPDEQMPESEAIARYLMSQGVAQEHILQENQSSSTMENMLFSWKKIQERTKDAKVAFSTTNYHVFRSGMMARRVKMRAQGMGSKTKWYFWPNAAVREFFGLLTQHRLKQGLILGCTVAVFIILAIVGYRLF